MSSSTTTSLWWRVISFGKPLCIPRDYDNVAEDFDDHAIWPKVVLKIRVQLQDAFPTMESVTHANAAWNIPDVDDTVFP